MITEQNYVGGGTFANTLLQTAQNAAHSTARNYKRQANQFPALPLTTRSGPQVAKSIPRIALAKSGNPYIGAQDTTSTAKIKPQIIESPFQAALLFVAENQRSKSNFSAFACYLNGKEVVAIERLNSLRGHNPEVDLAAVLKRAQRKGDFDGVIIATWHNPTSEAPYAVEFEEEVERQFYILLEADIKLVDNLRLSETGMYSYYGQCPDLFESPRNHKRGIGSLY